MLAAAQPLPSESDIALRVQASESRLQTVSVLFRSERAGRLPANVIDDTRWKVPSVIDWSTGVYNPRVDVIKDYAYAVQLASRGATKSPCQLVRSLLHIHVGWR